MIPTPPGAVPQTGSAPHQNWNALKHGLCSATILLPGDDAAAFHRERQALFQLCRPQTIREAQVVDAMADWQWQLDRSRPLQAQCDSQSLQPETDAAGRVIEPLAHRRMHTTIDVNLHRQRLDRALSRNQRELTTLPKLRRNGLIEGAVKLPPGCYMERSGEIVGPVPTNPIPAPAADAVPAHVAEGRQEIPRVPQVAPQETATGSGHGRTGFREEQQETLPPCPIAPGWTPAKSGFPRHSAPPPLLCAVSSAAWNGAGTVTKGST